MKTDALSLAALTIELVPADGDTVPAEAHLLPLGPFRANDGRPHETLAWKLDETIAAAVIARTARKANDILVDYEHQSLHTEWNGQPAPAAGWFRVLEWRDKGLYAANIRWTDRARTLIAAREYRYISAVFQYDRVTGEVLEIVSVALTNTPALDGLDALVAARTSPPTPTKETPMADEARAVAALTQERDNLLTEVAALKDSNAAITQERDTAVAELVALKAKAEEAALAAEKAERDALLEKVPPALKASVGNLPLAALKEYVEKAEPLGVLTKQADSKAAPGTAALTKEEATYCEKFGVSHEDFLKAKE